MSIAHSLIETRHFTLHVITRIPDERERVDIIDRLLQGAEHAKVLRRFRCMFAGRAADSATDPWPELISTLSKFPSLSVLEFVGFHWSTDEHGTRLVDMPSNLLEFHYVRAHKYNSGNASCQTTWCGLPRDAHHNLVEANSLTLLATTNCRTLTKLTLPGEMSRFEVLALVDWPSLSEIIIQGFPPSYESAPLICWLQHAALPSLEKLRIRLGRVHRETFSIFPAGYVLPDRYRIVEQGSDGPHESESSSAEPALDDRDASIQEGLDDPVHEPEHSPSELVLAETPAYPGDSSDAQRDDLQPLTKEDTPLDAPSTVTASRSVERLEPPGESDKTKHPSPKNFEEASSNTVFSSATQTDSHTPSGAAENSSSSLPTEGPEPPEELDNATEFTPKGSQGVSSEADVSSATQADSYKPLEDYVPLTLPSLRSLYVSNPSPDDMFWECIPSALDELALLGHPHWSHHGLMYDEYLRKEANMSSLKSDALMSILKKIRARSLTTLRISFWEGVLDDDLALIDFIVSSYPSLCRLEIHRYTSLGRSQSETLRFSASDLVGIHICCIFFLDYCQARLCDKLRVIETLRHLRLDIAYPDTVEVRSGYDYSGTIPDQMTKFKETSQERAMFVLQNLPQLQTLGLSCVGEYLEFYWKLFTPIHDDTGSVTAKLDEESNTKYLYAFSLLYAIRY